jgi:hypothetical protein
MLLSQITFVGSLQMLCILLVSMLIGAGAMTLRQRSMTNRLRLFHRTYGAGYMNARCRCASCRSSRRARWFRPKTI